MRVCLIDHHGKAVYLAGQLVEAGFEIVAPGERLDLLLLDTDHPDAPPKPDKHNYMLWCRSRGIPVGLYPHGGLSVLDYDGWRKPVPVEFELVHGPGHRAVYDAIGLKRRVEVVGWSYTECVYRMDQLLRSAKPRPIQHVVFAPIHPWSDGEGILDIHKAANEIAYQQFLEFPAEKKTVRMYGADAPNGVTHRVDGVEYTQSDLGLGIDLIDTADAVVSYGTFACTALARGKRVVMIDPYPAHWSDDGEHHAAHFDDYKDLCRYPACIGDSDLESLFRVDTSEWERNFIGGPLDVEKVAFILRQYKPNRAQRRRKLAA